MSIIFLFRIVEPGHRAVKFNAISGVGETIYREGWNMKIPMIERPIIYDVRTHPKTIKSSTGSKGRNSIKSETLRVISNLPLLL